MITPDAIVLFLAGLLAGEELAICIGIRPALGRLEASLQIPLRQALIRRLRVLVPILIFATLAAGVFAWHAAPGTLRLAGPAALLALIAVTLGGTVPINKAALAWNPAVPPSGWQESVRRWERLDIIRCWLALAAFALFIAAAGFAG
ncbi:MAG TPA: anthrone oxygenase family protein [Rhizomicrobium sp.]|jgi:uncharacterized membrane protein|nr:anthrone oxygenase family protein [Rhizomicrobium sp.]